MNYFKKSFLVLLIGIFSLPTVFPLFHTGFFEFHDNTQVVRVIEMGKSLSSGMFPVRWVEDLGYGYGYPIFNFYAPLPYYSGGFFNLVGLDPLFSTKAMLAIGILLSGVTMFCFSRRFFGNVGGIVSAVIYAYFPYHAVNIYIRGAVDEFFAYAFLPLVFLGLFELLQIKKGKIFNLNNFLMTLTISTGVFLVAVSHNLSIFMLFLLLVPYFIVSLFIVNAKKNYLLVFVSSIFLGILLSSFYILPAFMEMKYTNVLSQVGGGADFKDHFVCLNQYWNSAWGFGGSVKGCLDGMSFKLGKLNILLIILTSIIFGYSLYKKKFRNQEKTVILSLILFLITLFFTLSVSEFIWNSVPYMAYLQYPWRFINFLGLFISFLVGYIAFRVKEWTNLKIEIVICAAVISITIFQNHKLFVPQIYTNHTPNYYTAKNYINYTVSKISDEYMPSGFSIPKNPVDIPINDVEILKTTGIVKVLIKSPKYLKASYDIQNDGVLHVNLAYFPSWKAYVNNENVPIVPNSNGVNISVKKGNGILEMKFAETYVELIGNILTIISFFALVVGIIALVQKKR